MLLSLNYYLFKMRLIINDLLMLYIEVGMANISYKANSKLSIKNHLYLYMFQETTKKEKHTPTM